MRVRLTMMFNNIDFCNAAMRELKALSDYSSTEAKLAGEYVPCPGLSMAIQYISLSIVATITSNAKYDIKLDVDSSNHPVINIINKGTDEVAEINLSTFIDLYTCNGYSIHCF